MKKLMIVAAVAAMAGAAVAVDGYDFTASVKTTKGKKGSQSTTYYVNLGTDANGVYWWDSAQTYIENWANEKEAKRDVAAWVKDAKRDGFDGSDLEIFLNNIHYTPSTVRDNGDNDFGWKEYYKKARWCYSFSYTVKNEDCYRVAASRKIKGIVYIDGCCDAGAATTWEYVADDDVIFADADADWNGYITPGILYRFGGVDLDKASKVEFTGVAGSNIGFDALTVNTFALAGQGAWDVKNGYLKNISGNIVGVLENPDCESCCDYDKAACFYACDGLHSEKDGSIIGTEGTAAFGTWSIKYNKRY